MGANRVRCCSSPRGRISGSVTAVWWNGAGSPRPGSRSGFNPYPYLAPNSPPFPKAPMGWQQYACWLCVSSQYHYILYLISNVQDAVGFAEFCTTVERTSCYLRVARDRGPCSGGRCVRAPRRSISSKSKPIVAGWPHGHVHIFENCTRCDTAHAVGGFDEIIAGFAAVLASENIHESHWFS
jgi:hypothetical protein